MHDNFPHPLTLSAPNVFSTGDFPSQIWFIYLGTPRALLSKCLPVTL